MTHQGIHRDDLVAGAPSLRHTRPTEPPLAATVEWSDCLANGNPTPDVAMEDQGGGVPGIHLGGGS